MPKISELWNSLKQGQDERLFQTAVGAVFFIYLLFSVIFSLSSPAPEHRQADRLILTQAEALVKHGKVFDNLTPLAFAKVFIVSLPLRYVVEAEVPVQLFALRITSIIIGLGVLYAFFQSARNIVDHRLFSLLALAGLALNPSFIVLMTTLAAHQLTILLIAVLIFFSTEIVKNKAKVVDIAMGLVVVYLLFRLVPKISLQIALPTLVAALALGAFSEYGAGLLDRIKEKRHFYLAPLIIVLVASVVLTRLNQAPDALRFYADSLLQPLTALSSLSAIIIDQAGSAAGASGLPAGFEYAQSAIKYVLVATGVISLLGLLLIFISSFSWDAIKDRLDTFPNAALIPVALATLLVGNAAGLWKVSFFADRGLQALLGTMLSIFLALGLFEVSVGRKSVIGDVAIGALATTGLAALLVITLFQ